jgi:hypothetical protein
MQGEHGDFLIVQAVAGDLTAFAVEDEIVRAVPVLADV